MNYKTAGVDIEKANRLVERIKEMMGESGARIGHFGGMIPLPISKYKNPLLVTSTDSVGTKVMVASALNKWDTIGQDIVHHGINDIACCGAEPLSFVDYIAMSKLDSEIGEQIIAGLIEACKRWGTSLVGGEVAEMPGVYQPGEIDLVGTISGLVEKAEVINGEGIEDGDVLIGFGSDGIHTNGFSLVRRILKESKVGYDTRHIDLGCTMGEALITVHYCYLNEIRALKATGVLKGLAHITGGGMDGNISRIIPDGLNIEVEWGSWEEPLIFTLLRRLGNVPEHDMRLAFNLGIGLVAVVAQSDVEDLLGSKVFKKLKKPVIIGKVVKPEPVEIDVSESEE